MFVLKRNSEVQNEIEPSPFSDNSKSEANLKTKAMAKTHGGRDILDVIPQQDNLVRQSSMEPNLEERLNIHATIPEPNRASSQVSLY